MKKIFILCCAVLMLFAAHAQKRVSTGIDAAGNSIALGTSDPFWTVSPASSPQSPYAVWLTKNHNKNYYTSNTWEVTPLASTHAEWIGPDQPLDNVTNTGVYTFERTFHIYSGTGNFACNFSVADDDVLVSLELVSPNASTIALTAVPVTTQYKLSQLITKAVNCPDIGDWKIRAKVNYIDHIGGFLLSGTIDTSKKPTCDTTCKFSLTGFDGTSLPCGSTLNLQCGNSYDFGPQLNCNGSQCPTQIIGVSLLDPSLNTPSWAATFLNNGGNGLLTIPAGIAPGNYQLTYYYGLNGDTCGSCSYNLVIDCHQENHCVKKLVFYDFNTPAVWTPDPMTGNATSISGGTFNFNNTPGAGYNRQYRSVTGLPAASQTIFARVKLLVNSGNAPAHHILTLYQTGTSDPVSLDASGGYAATSNDAIIVDLTAPSGPASTTSDQIPTSSTNPWQFNLRYKIGTTLVTCPAKINFTSLNTPYYVQLERGGNTLKLSVFSDPNYTTHVPGSPICFPINGTLNPLGFVNLGVYTWASAYRNLTAQLDSLSICSGTDLVVCNPPCDSTCNFTLTAGGVSSTDFNCGDTIKLKCKNTYDFGPHLDCKGTGSSSLVHVSLVDAYGNIPTWAASFLSNNGGGTLSLPGGITAGIYTLTYYWGIGGNTCDSCKFFLDIKCPCDCKFKNSITIGGVTTNLNCGDTVSIKCQKKYKFKPDLKCKDTSIHMIHVSVHDGAGNTPTWANSFISNLGNGPLNIPNNISGIYSVTYVWGSNGNPCDSCTYFLNITCCKCVFNLTFEGNGVFSTFNCGDTIKAKCGGAYLTPLLRCDDSTIHVIRFSLTDVNGNIPSWAVGYNGIGGFVIPSGVNGVYTLNYVWGSNGQPCDSCKIYLSVICCPSTPCTLTTSFGLFHGPRPKSLKCRDTALISCGSTYDFGPSLNCNGDTSSHISNVILHDAFGNTPSWATSFVSNLGSGLLSVPANIPSGYYTLVYYWGVGSLTCDSCKYILKLQCCKGFKVDAGQDITTCCPSAGTPLNAIVNGGVSPYIYSWTPTTGLNNSNIANPISTSTGTYVVTVKDAFGCIITDTVKIIYCGVNGCRIAGNNTKAQAYPNPFTHGFALKIPANTVADVQVINLHGTPLETKSKISGTVQMGTKLAYGAYTIVVNYNDGTREEIKIIKSPN